MKKSEYINRPQLKIHIKEEEVEKGRILLNHH